MTKMKFLTALVLTLGLAFGGAVTSASASEDYTRYSGSWVPTDEDQNAIGFKNLNCSNAISLYIYGMDATSINPNSASNLKLFDFTPGQVFNATTFALAQSGGDWLITTSYGTLNLGSTQEFGLYYWDQVPSMNPRYPDVTTEVPGKIYMLSDDCATVYLIDAAPVPLPGTAWLFAPALLSLVRLRGKFNG